MIKVLASEMHLHPHAQVLREHVVRRMRNPDPGSMFERASRQLAHMDDTGALAALMAAGYDGILLYADRVVQRVLGDVFFQPQNSGTELHFFACMVHERHRGIGIGTRLMKAFFEHAWERKFRKVRISEGNDKVVFHMYDNVVNGKIHFTDFRVVEGGGVGKGWAQLIP